MTEQQLDGGIANAGKVVRVGQHVLRPSTLGPDRRRVDQARLGWRPADRPARLRLVADAYGLDPNGRAELLAALDDAISRIESAVRRSVGAGNPGAVAMWNRTGGSERFDRRRRWWTSRRGQFAAALL